ncbi:hypothetical protein BDP27DRAFT_1321455 [Rhodocollybia butyracea]|uniref:Glycosyltransferase 61 catalytic domain-containing protein n=1 Tax=Rhodocollybia butyracea TaxID=206335 RepID=A0A9P5PZ08_9AGAR|nr:hypothetical protein BDP27DRAFT_1321455 [Rhodocollybia butyracea]
MSRKRQYFAFIFLATSILFIGFAFPYFASVASSVFKQHDAHVDIIEPILGETSPGDIIQPILGEISPGDIIHPILGETSRPDLDLTHPKIEVSFPTTSIPHGAHVNGFTIFDNLYLRNGTFFAVSLDPSTFPPKEAILSAPLDLGVPSKELLPTDKHLRYIDLEEAVQLLGHNPLHIDDMTVIIYDTKTFLRHYYHWWGEVILGFWRVYSMINEPGPLPFPSRFMLPVVEEGQWRDRADINGPLLRAMNPSVSIETSGQWNDFIKLNRTIAFKRVGIVNRAAAHRHSEAGKYNKMIGPTMGLEIFSGYWKPLQTKLTQNLLGESSESPQDITRETATTVKSKPVVIYISRQKTGRRLADKDHEALVHSLLKLQDEGFCKVEIPVMENLSVKEQIELVSRSTIMVGVHGNGLTHQLWMPSSSWSTVIEIFFPGGYLFDYQFLSRSAEHQHYAVWNDTSFTTAEAPKSNLDAEGMHGSEIPVYGPTVVDIIRQRLATLSSST